MLLIRTKLNAKSVADIHFQQMRATKALNNILELSKKLNLCFVTCNKSMIQNATYFKCSGKLVNFKKYLLEFTVMIKALYKRYLS